MRLWEWTRTCLDYVLANSIKSRDFIRLQLANNCYLRVLAYNKQHRHNLLVIQGGIMHFNDQTPHYIKMLTSLMSTSANIFHLEQVDAAINLDSQIRDTAAAVDYINHNFCCRRCCCRSQQQPHHQQQHRHHRQHQQQQHQTEDSTITVIGFSMGGVAVLSYLSSLSSGTRNDDSSQTVNRVKMSYITVCSPFDLEYLYKYVIQKEPMFKRLCQQQLKAYNSSSIDDLCSKYGVTVDGVIADYNQRLRTLKSCDNLLCLAANQDIITSGLVSDMARLQVSCQVIDVKSATHCCDLCVLTLVRVLRLQFIHPELSLTDLACLL